MKRIIHKETKLFLRDDFDYSTETEIGLEVEPAQGLYKPMWSGEITEDEDGNLSIGDGQWLEGATQEEIDEMTKVEPQEPGEITTLMLSIAELDMQREMDKLQNQLAMAELVDMIIGGGI